MAPVSSKTKETRSKIEALHKLDLMVDSFLQAAV